ncbi:hypothetical protein BDFG_09340, partial [Blastomyces dermatitidis ATCC 26199]
SSHIDRSVSADDSELNIKSLIENLKNIIMKKLSVSCVTESLTSSSALSVSFSAALSQCSTSASVSDYPAPATPVPATPGFTTSAFVISSSCFKEILCRLNELCLSMKNICVFRNKNADVILFYIYKFSLISETILIKDDNTAETLFSHSQASSIAFSSFSAEKIVHTLSY